MIRAAFQRWERRKDQSAGSYLPAFVFQAGFMAARRMGCTIHRNTKLRCPACTAAKNTGSTPARRRAAKQAWQAAVKIRRARRRT